MQCIKDKTLIYMHIKQLYFLFIFLYKCTIKNTYKHKHVDDKNKAKGTILYNHQIDSRMP